MRRPESVQFAQRQVPQTWVCLFSRFRVQKATPCPLGIVTVLRRVRERSQSADGSFGRQARKGILLDKLFMRSGTKLHRFA
jgi:hypothetical protein